MIEILRAILKGDLLKRLQMDYYFIHIVYTFVIFLISIWIGLGIEESLGKVEKNQKTITELHYENSRLVFELAKVSSRPEVATNLSALGSNLKESSEPSKSISYGREKR